MAKKQEINGVEIHSEEVQDILGPIPGSLLNWGGIMIFILFFIVIAGTYFFSFNEMVTAPTVITTSNPPAPLISNVSGRIEHWFVTDGEMVGKGDCIALIANSANLKDVVCLEQLIDSIGSKPLGKGLERKSLPKELVLGEIQTTYSQFVKNWEDYSSYVTGHFIDRKIDLLEQEKSKQNDYYKLLQEQKILMDTELQLSERKYSRNESMLVKGGMSETELDNSQAQLLQSKRSYLSFLGSLKSNEMTITSQEKAILELKEQNQSSIDQFERTLEDNVAMLKKVIGDWKSKYLISSPIKGKVTLTKFWSENHVISGGERLATIVPENSNGNTIICRANVPSSSIGKVETGQKVNLKLSGFPFMQYGMLLGRVNSISLVPENNEYIVEIQLDEGMKSNYSEQLKLVQEMEGTAEIITRKSRLINRFINPLRSIIKSGQ